MNKRGTVIDWMIVILTIIFLFMLVIPSFFGAKVEARLYNQKFNKNYTTWDFIFAGQTIKEFLNGGKQQTNNINLNGAIPIKIEQ
jgi:hypothetical protein